MPFENLKKTAIRDRERFMAIMLFFELNTGLVFRQKDKTGRSLTAKSTQRIEKS